MSFVAEFLSTCFYGFFSSMVFGFSCDMDVSLWFLEAYAIIRTCNMCFMEGLDRNSCLKLVYLSEWSSTAFQLNSRRLLSPSLSLWDITVLLNLLKEVSHEEEMPVFTSSILFGHSGMVIFPNRYNKRYVKDYLVLDLQLTTHSQELCKSNMWRFTFHASRVTFKRIGGSFKIKC